MIVLFVRYENTLYDNRLIVIGLSKQQLNTEDDLTQQQDKSNCNIPEPTSPSAAHPLNANSLLKNVKQNVKKNDQKTQIKTAELDINTNNKRLSNNGKTYVNGTSATASSHIWYYESYDDTKDLEQRLHEFASSIFWILESKRLDRAFERQDKPVLLLAPFEGKDFVGIDTESR